MSSENNPAQSSSSLEASSSAIDAPRPNVTETAAEGNTATQLPDPALPAPNLGEDEVGFTAADLIAQQQRLEVQANEAIPFAFDTCTHSKGYIRQPIYACKTCGGGGVCAGCSVSCHSEHELVELFNKRKFRCDCGTPNLFKDTPKNGCAGQTAIKGELAYPDNAKPCSLRTPGFDPQNDANRYNHNFVGSFCYCERGKTYDPEKEDETMFQCIVCEEWLHESCTSLRPSQPSSTAAAAAAATTSAPVTTSSSTTTTTTTQPEPEPPLIDHDLFDLMICDACVRKPGNEILRTYAGSKGWMILAPTADVTDVKEWDGIKAIQVPTQNELENASKELTDSRSWHIFGLPMEAEQAITQSDVAAAADGALLSSVADLVRSSQSAKTEPSATTSSETPITAGPRQLGTDTEEGHASQGQGQKRVLDAEETGTVDELPNKRLKNETEMPNTSSSTTATGSSCRLPQALPVVSALPASVTEEWAPARALNHDSTTKLQRYDIFLADDFRARICRCSSCLPRWEGLPHVLDAEETYAPPSDPNASLRNDDDDDDAASITSSTYDLGMAALRSMPREKMINSLHAYSKFRDALWEHLKPFAGSGKMVTEQDVRAFFAKTMGAEKP
ncbi:hypothetical protein BCV70DRAFT_200367 [Testicularia cyperi]|uniref:UBR-type domain-containing protein n=1 Tax=Testicularia cyperi TaxID=1882483 RepID=A0A317XQP5_9BASI|nr:hypothetical protein BCV70DRAFT_200367 [Testicularia cyperi]